MPRKLPGDLRNNAEWFGERAFYNVGFQEVRAGRAHDWNNIAPAVQTQINNDEMNQTFPLRHGQYTGPPQPVAVVGPGLPRIGTLAARYVVDIWRVNPPPPNPAGAPPPLPIGLAHSPALETVSWLVKKLDYYEGRFRFVQMLGYGGQGIAALFDRVDESDRRVGPPIVVKSGIVQTRTHNSKELVRRQKALKDEVLIQKDRCARGVHIIQVYDPVNLQGKTFYLPPHSRQTILNIAPRNWLKRLRGAPKPYPELHSIKNVAFMEYCQRGSVAGWISHLWNIPAGGYVGPPNPAPIDEAVLWEIFKCLVKGCVAMKYPPFDNPPLNTGAGPAAFYNIPGSNVPGPAYRSETNPEMPGAAPPIRLDNMVHFDIDEYNVMIGGFNTNVPAHPIDNHGVVPVFKLGDFGLAEVMGTNHMGRKRGYELWVRRQHGKNDFKTPEAFTEEWDWVYKHPHFPPTRGPAPQSSRFVADTAGRYGTETNIYQIGNVMATIITGHEHPENFQPGQAGQAVQIAHPVHGAVWSYGGWLNEPPFNGPYMSNALRDLVQQCLCERPSHRPTLGELEQRIDAEIAAIAASATPFNPNTVNQCFGGVPVLAQRNRQDVSDWALSRIDDITFHGQQPIAYG